MLLTVRELTQFIKIESAVTVVDCKAWMEQRCADSFNARMAGCMRNSSTVVLNKIDLVSEKTVDQISAEVQSAAPGVEVMVCSFGDICVDKVTTRAVLLLY